MMRRARHNRRQYSWPGTAEGIRSELRTANSNAMLSVSMRGFIDQQITVDTSGRSLSLALELAAGLTMDVQLGLLESSSAACSLLNFKEH